MTSELVKAVVEEGVVDVRGGPSWMKKFQTEPGETVVGVVIFHRTILQARMPCDNCGRYLPLGSEVLGKVVNLSKGILVGSRFSPTCIECAEPTLQVPDSVTLVP